MKNSVPSWGELLDRVRSSGPSVIAPVVAAAREVAAKEVLGRVYRYEDIGQRRSREPFPEMCKNLEKAQRETFALAMSDHLAGMQVAQELPLLAAAYRLTGDANLGHRALAQLEEMASWSPLQRPGWTLFAPGNRLPPDGKDGNWLATGTGARAIANALAILPADSVPSELRARLRSLLEREIDGVVDDWKQRRSWFIKANNAASNQWVLPTEGLIHACLVTDVERHRQAYELGVTNLLQSFDAHGTAGEFEEGLHYAEFTVSSMLHAARAMAAAGDRRALDHPFLKTFPTWAAHHIQPGRFLINCFDSFGSCFPRDPTAQRSHVNFARFWALLLVCTESPVARWVLREQLDCPPPDELGLICHPLFATTPAPPLFVAYERATRVNWRDSWNDNATGVWVRGGHATDQHDHADRGHVNLIRRGVPILIEAGTAYYDHPKFDALFGSGSGHNVLQLGVASQQRRVAPITVRRLDATGGLVIVDGSKCYDGLDSWQREVSWSAKEMQVTDRVTLPAGRQDTMLFRWHLGTEQRPTVEASATAATVRWRDATLTLRATETFAVELEMYPDFTLTDRAWEDRSPDHEHVCLVVRTVHPVGAWNLETRVM